MMQSLVSAFIGLGGLGLFIITAIDASYLLIPLTNDLLMILLVAHHNMKLPYYALMAALGSMAGAFTLDVVFRRGGQKIEAVVSRKRFDYVKTKMEKRTGWALGLSALLPPPFPMKPAVIAAAALQYPRRKMFTIIGITRFARYGAIGLIGVFFSRQVVAFMQSPILGYIMYFLIALAVLGSTFAVLRWVRQSRQEPGGGGGENTGDRPQC